MSGPSRRCAGGATRARAFVRDEAGFAQVTTIDGHGYPVCRSMTAFLLDGWSVDLCSVAATGGSASCAANPRRWSPGSARRPRGRTNERPHVFDLGRLPPRAVSVRGTRELMDDDWTEAVYARHAGDSALEDSTRAPLRDAVRGRRRPRRRPHPPVPRPPRGIR